MDGGSYDWLWIAARVVDGTIFPAFKLVMTTKERGLER